MLGALIILAVTLVTGLILFITHRLGNDDPATAEGDDSSPSADDDAEECCGLHAVCERIIDSAEGPVYYDDEELDRFAGRDPQSYTTEEIDEFSRVLYTLIPSDVFPWGASLTLRGIALPTALRDEWLMLCEDGSQPPQ